MNASEPTITGLSRAQYEEAKVRFNWRFGCHLVTLVAALVSAFTPSPIAYIFAVVAFVSESLAWWFRFDGSRLKSLADEARRYVLLVDALGLPADTFASASLRQRFTNRAERRAPKFEHEAYYASSQRPGAQRFKECLQESVFWSAYLYRKAAKRALLLPFGGMLIVLMLLLVALPLAPAGTPLLIARALIIVLAFVATSDELGRVIDWYTAGNDADLVDRRLTGIDVTRTEPILAAFTDYEVITACAPPISTSAYKAHHKRLNALWDERQLGRFRPES